MAVDVVVVGSLNSTIREIVWRDGGIDVGCPHRDHSTNSSTAERTFSCIASVHNNGLRESTGTSARHRRAEDAVEMPLQCGTIEFHCVCCRPSLSKTVIPSKTTTLRADARLSPSNQFFFVSQNIQCFCCCCFSSVCARNNIEFST